MADFELSYTAEEIDAKLGKIDNLSTIEFITNIEEATDTTKKYVLPNGNIYEYGYIITTNYTNVLLKATSEEGGTEIYNADDTPGWKSGYRISSSGTFMEIDGMCVTGYIPIKYGDIIKVKNITFEGSAAPYIVLYVDGVFATVITPPSPDDNGIVTFTINSKYTTSIRLSAGTINESSIITINEEITDESIGSYQWIDTEYAFITKDDKNKVNTIEETVQINSEKIINIEEILSGTESEDGITSEAVKEAVSNVVDIVLSRDDSRIIRFLAISDAHHTDGNAIIAAGTKELGQAVNEILDQIGVDFVANLGDSTWGSSASDNITVLKEGKAFNKHLSDSIRGENQIWTEGNHETGILTASQIHALVYSHNKGLTQDANHWIEGYGYMDFPNQKVRVICLNTNQGPKDVICGMSNEQLKWFAEIALNMSGKTDWGVITMGHHPLSYSTVSLFRYAAETLKAFINKENFSFKTNDNFTFGLDYSDKSCEYIGHFHGHVHSYTILPIQRYVSSDVYEEIGAWEICIPNACATRTDQYSSTLEDGHYLKRYCVGGIDYHRPEVDGQRTAFTIVTICLDNKIIYADDYGIAAPIDRYIHYGEEEKTVYSITNNLTNVVNSNPATSIIENTTYTATLTAVDGYTMDGASVVVTMGGVDISSSYANGVLNIASVTGDIIITAVATAIDTSPINLLDFSQRTYVSIAEPQYIETNVAREIDYSKCYAIYKDGRRGQYPSSKIITYTQDADVNGFTFQVSSGSGYGIEFPVDVQSGQEYSLWATVVTRTPYVYLIKYNADTTVNTVEMIHDANAGGIYKQITFTPEVGYLYSVAFITTLPNTDIQVEDISLKKTV